jgi:hypothetical protein
LVLALAIGLAAGSPLARLLWVRIGGGVKAGFTVVAVLGLGTLLGLSLVLFAADDYRLLTAYEEASCEVTDRLIVPETVMQVGPDRGASSTQGFRPLLALRLLLPEGPRAAIWGDGDGGQFLIGELDWAQEVLAAYEPGGAYPCWYDSRDHQSLALRRQFSWGPLLLSSLLLVGLALPPALILRRSRPGVGARVA